MFSSYFGGSKDAAAAPADGSAPIAGTSSVGALHPPHERLKNPDSTFGPLTSQDTSWLCAAGFAVETQTFYGMTGGSSPKFLMVQVIHSAVGMWYPQIQFTFRLYDPATGKAEWRTTNVTNFVTAPSTSGVTYDKRSCKSDQFSILLDPASPDTYSIEGNYDANTQVSLKFKRAERASGWKLGSGPKGGFTYFGAEKQSTAKDGAPDNTIGADGYVIHRFWPRCTVSGIIRVDKDITSVDQSVSRGIFIHAIQGMRPNLIACRWDFGYFNSIEAKEGVSLMMMEFTATFSYGSKKVTMGSVVVDDELVAVIADGTVQHLEEDPVDTDTSYPAPGKISYKWNSAKSLLPTPAGGEPGKVSAEILLDLQPESGSNTTASGARTFRGLVEKVDVLAQIPYLVKKVLSYVAGTKPYVYQFYNPTQASITLPSEDGKESRSLTVDGYMFSEATFISAS